MDAAARVLIAIWGGLCCAAGVAGILRPESEARQLAKQRRMIDRLARGQVDRDPKTYEGSVRLLGLAVAAFGLGFVAWAIFQ